MTYSRCSTLYIALALVASSQELGAQALPFIFVDAPPTVTRPRSVLQLDAAIGDRTTESVAGNGFQSGLRATFWFTPRLAILARGSTAADSGRQRGMAQAELRWRPVGSVEGATALAFGVGVRREYAGTSVLLATASGARTIGRATFGAKLALERPLDSDRDAVDAIVAAGWSHRVTDAVRVGIEAIGEDLEGFWDTAEAEGGATLFAGPTLTLGSPLSRWSFIVDAGPVVRATRSQRTSGAARDLAGTATGYTMRTALRVDLGR